MHKLIIALLLCLHSLSFGSEGAVVFIHIGTDLPGYLETACRQFQRFNPEIPLYVAVNAEALAKKPALEKIQWISLEELPMSDEHLAFLAATPLQNGFWKYTSERFLYLYDLMQYKQLKHVVHLENDNMLYVNLNRLFPILKKHYPGLAATFDNEDRCIAGFMYIRNGESLKPLAQHFAKLAQQGSIQNDMIAIAAFKKNSAPSIIDALPIIPRSYTHDYPLISPAGHETRNPSNFCKHFDRFLSVFDAAALGQYLGNNKFINESCLFNPAHFKYRWFTDGKGRKVPYILYNKKLYRINNLHIHSKDLDAFKS